MDISTIIGLVMGAGLMFWAITGKSDLGTFVDVGSVAIVMGGALSLDGRFLRRARSEPSSGVARS